MKIAYHLDNQQPISACAAAPQRAVCPHCGGIVMLRQRQRMDGERIYFWRHLDNRNRVCNGRSRPVKA